MTNPFVFLWYEKEASTLISFVECAYEVDIEAALKGLPQGEMATAS